MKKMLSVLLAAMMLLSLLAVPALAEDQVLTVVTWDATTTAYLTAQKEAQHHAGRRRYQRRDHAQGK